jgi:hypothetical protein
MFGIGESGNKRVWDVCVVEEYINGGGGVCTSSGIYMGMAGGGRFGRWFPEIRKGQWGIWNNILSKRGFELFAFFY